MNKKRLIKNILMITLIVITIAALVFTIYYKNTQTSSNSEMMNSGNNMNGGGTPPDMNNQSNGSSESGTPPEKPDGESSDSSSTPPEKPDGEDNQTTSDNSSSNDSASNNNSGQNQNSTSDNSNQNSPNTPPDMNNQNSQGNNNTMQSTSSTSTSNVFYYIIFGIEGLIISVTLSYLIMSGFNKKTFKETFKTSDKTVIYILLVLLLTGTITVGSNMIKLNSTSTSTDNNMQEGQGQTTTSSASYSAAAEITESTTVEDKEYTSTTKDENALSVSGDIDVTAKGITATKTGDSDGGDNTSFYGTNSAIIAKSGANLTIEDADITTDATGANGVFSYGGSATTNNSSSDGTTVTIKNSKITTKKDNSGGIMTTGGGTTIASNLTIKTSGTSSAAIRTDRGGGTVEVDKGTYETSGQGSPTIYSTADITVKNATLTSTASEGVVIEGKNKVTLENVKLTDTNNKLNGQSTTYKNIFLYQSMSGDADTGISEFSAKNSTITTNKGDSFYITNTTSKITLENNTIKNTDSDGYFLRAQKDSWGNSGSNGGDVTLILKNQTVKGNIYIDEISTLDMTLKDKSSYTGSINTDNTAKSIKLTLSKNSKIKLTGDSYISELDDADEDYSNIDFNGYKLYVNGTAIN